MKVPSSLKSPTTYRYLEELSHQLQTGLAQKIWIKILRCVLLEPITNIKQKYVRFSPTESNYSLYNERQFF